MNSATLTSALVSWIAALAMLALASAWGGMGETLPAGEWPLAMAATGVVHLLGTLLVFGPIFYLLERAGMRAMAPLVLGLAGFLPLTLFIAAFGGRPADVVSPEGRLFAVFFVTGGGVFGLMRARPIAQGRASAAEFR